MKTEDDPRWDNIVTRSADADGTFWYSVKTTGVYCRPSCASRLPLPRNVQFYDSPELAEEAGFRACKRCRPQQGDVVAEACRIMEEADTIIPLNDLAGQVGLSPHHFHRLFKRRTGVTPRDYGTACRTRRLQQQMQTAPSITEAALNAGYNTNSRFYDATRQTLGMAPGQYRQGGDKATIRFAIGQCSLGAVLVAQSDEGICAILLGEAPEPLVGDLQERFPKATLVGGDARFESLVATVAGFVDNPRQGLDLPLDIRGTAFQQRVWNILKTIPPGETVSYGEVARRLEAPSSMRAVAQACGANPLAVAIPCHRVVRVDGGLGGYRWGIERKQALLEAEK